MNVKGNCVTVVLQSPLQKYFPFFFCSVVFWFGDLNFRIDDLDMQVVKSSIDNNKFPVLWEKDQVRLKAA